MPTTGEKVVCGQCGQKFRFETHRTPEDDAEGASPPGEGSDEGPAPQAEQPPALDEFARMRCPRCGEEVGLPTSGQRTTCPGCGQSYRLDLAEEARPAAAPPPLPEGEEPGTEDVREIDCPRCGRAVSVPTSGEKVRCPGCGQKFRVDPALAARAAEVPEAPQAEPDPDELRSLWPPLCQLIVHCYQEGQADDDQRLRFRTQADRATELATRLIPEPEGEPSPGYHVLTGVLRETTLDEILGLSLEDFRHLEESLDDAQRLLDEQLAQERPLPSLPSATPRPPPPAQRPERRTSRLGIVVGLVSIAAAAAAAVVILPKLRERAREDTTEARARDATPEPQPLPGDGRGDEEPPDTSTRNPAAKKKGDDGRSVPRVEDPTAKVQVPDFQPPEPRPEDTQPEPTPATPDTEPQPEVRRVQSRWKPGPDKWIQLFDGKSLEGWDGDPDSWTLRPGGVLEGQAPDGSASLAALDAAWTDYQLALDFMLGRSGTLLIHQGSLTAVISDKGLRLGYPGINWQVLDETRKAPDRGKWYSATLDVHGQKAQLAISGKTVLASAGRQPQPGNPVIEVDGGAVRVRNVRLRLHESDPAYEAVALGKGYLVPVEPESPDGTQVDLGPGVHTLFKGEDLEGWKTTGRWAVRRGAMVGKAPFDEIAVAAAGSPEWRDYVLKTQCRLTREGRMPRQGEYMLVMVRYQDPANFSCVRFVLEGIIELGVYRNGRWRETGRARHGLRNDFNKWHDVTIKVQGDKLQLFVDGHDRRTWPLSGWNRGGVALGVTGGEAAFRDVKINVLR